MVIKNIDIIYAKTLSEALLLISEKIYINKLIKDKNKFIDFIKKREKIGSLYIGNGIYLPHVKGNFINKNSIYVYNLEKSIGKVEMIIVILVKENALKKDLKEIIELVTSLDDENFVNLLKEGNYGN